MRGSKKNQERHTKRRAQYQRRRHDVDPHPMFETVEFGGALWFVVDFTEGGAPIGLRVDDDPEHGSDDAISI